MYTIIVEGPRVIPDSAQPTGIIVPSPSTKWSIVFDQVVRHAWFHKEFLLGEGGNHACEVTTPTFNNLGHIVYKLIF